MCTKVILQLSQMDTNIFILCEIGLIKFVVHVAYTPNDTFHTLLKCSVQIVSPEMKINAHVLQLKMIYCLKK